MKRSRPILPALTSLVILAFIPMRAVASGEAESYETDAIQSAEHLIGGLQAKRAADLMPDTRQRRSRYEQAAAQLSRSVALSPSYGGLVALGEVYLALEQTEDAIDTCSRALLFKPEQAAAAKDCVDRGLDQRDQAQMRGERGPVR
jgi:tetratricopeptide (TPR) repeat protein